MHREGRIPCIRFCTPPAYPARGGTDNVLTRLFARIHLTGRLLSYRVRPHNCNGMGIPTGPFRSAEPGLEASPGFLKAKSTTPAFQTPSISSLTSIRPRPLMSSRSYFVCFRNFLSPPGSRFADSPSLRQWPACLLAVKPLPPPEKDLRLLC